MVEGQEHHLRRGGTSVIPFGRCRGGARRGSFKEDELARESKPTGPHGAYTVDEVALRHGASVEEDVQDADVAYAGVPPSKPTRYRDGWLRG